MKYGIKIILPNMSKEIWYSNRRVRNKAVEEMWSKSCYRESTCWREKNFFSLRWFDDLLHGYVKVIKIVRVWG